MQIKWVLLTISLILSLGPICGAILVYRGNLLALVTPTDIEFFENFSENLPQIELVDCNLTELTLTVNISNPLETTLHVDSVSAEIFCKTHSVHLGQLHESAPLDILPKTSGLFTLQLELTSAGEEHIQSLHDDGDIEIELRNFELCIQGITVRVNQQSG